MRWTWDVLDVFAVAPPALVDERTLQRRTESKFVMSVEDALAVVRELRRTYVIVTTGTARVARYRSVYFDTPGLEFFHAHRRGRRVRHKLRLRHYADRAMSVLEVKTRLTEVVTTKARLEHRYGHDRLDPGDVLFAAERTSTAPPFVPQAVVEYARITLMSLHDVERVTIDIDLSVTRGSSSRRIGGVAVIEVKQPRLNRRTAAMMALRHAGHRVGPASKYCVAIATMRPDVRISRLRGHLRALQAASVWVR